MSRTAAVTCLLATLAFWPLGGPTSAQVGSVSSPLGAPRPQTPPRDNAKPATGKAILRGRVVAADSGLPLRRAQVSISGGELRERRMTTTDVNGRYEFKDLPAGRYGISATKSSYITLSYGQTRPRQSGTPLQILDGQIVEKVDFSLPRGSVITGRILDEFGEPMSEVQVSALQSAYAEGGRRLIPSRGNTTNDIGEFRIFGLTPGQYFLSASMQRGFMIADSDDRSGYAPTYYPGTPDEAAAQRITVEVGQTISDLVMTLAPTKTARITGTAVNAQGRPLSGFVMLSRRSSFSGAPGGQIRPDGTFSISGVVPGDYTINVNSEAEEFVAADVTVSGEDMNDVRLVGVPFLTVSGRLKIDAAAAGSFQPSEYRVFASTVAVAFGPGSKNGDIADDLTFSVKTRPGKMRLSVGPKGPVTSRIALTTRAVRVADVDVIDSGIDIKAGEDVTGVEIEMTDRISNLSGVVTDGDGHIVKDYTVVVFSRDRDKWENSRYRRTSRPDQDGRFKITGLPAGDYVAAALDSVDPEELNDPNFLEQIRKAAPFTINEGETKMIDLRMSQL